MTCNTQIMYDIGPTSSFKYMNQTYLKIVYKPNYRKTCKTLK